VGARLGGKGVPGDAGQPADPGALSSLGGLGEHWGAIRRGTAFLLVCRAGYCLQWPARLPKGRKYLSPKVAGGKANCPVLKHGPRSVPSRRVKGL